MKAFDRRSAIVRYLQRHGRASTYTLSQEFGVSEVTIRHDLRTLEKQAGIVRIHGGASLIPQLKSEQSFAERQALNAVEKMRIAEAAAARISPGDTVLVGISSSAYYLTPYLQDLSDLRVVTNSLHVSAALSPCPGIEVILIGGNVRDDIGSIVGPLAEDMLSKLHAEKGFLGSAGFTVERGLTDADSRVVQVKRAMIKSVAEVNILLDSSKFGQQSFLSFAALDEIDHLFTDDAIPEEYIDICNEHGIQLTIV